MLTKTQVRALDDCMNDSDRARGLNSDRLGYGAMGQLVGRLAAEQGHEIALTLDVEDADRSVEDLAKALRGCDVAIDFSIADTVPKNAEACALAGVPIVVGTT